MRKLGWLGVAAVMALTMYMDVGTPVAGQAQQEIKYSTPPPLVISTLDGTLAPYTLGAEFQVVMTIEASGGINGQTRVRVYRNGVARGFFDTPMRLSDLDDLHTKAAELLAFGVDMKRRPGALPFPSGVGVDEVVLSELPARSAAEDKAAQRYGKVQVVFDPQECPDTHGEAGSVRNEDVLRVTGNVVARSDKDVNPKLPTGDIDIRATKLEVLNKSRVVPFEPSTTMGGVHDERPSARDCVDETRTWYSPCRSPSMRYAPSGLISVLRDAPMVGSRDTSTISPASGRPSALRTIPKMLPRRVGSSGTFTPTNS